MWSTTCSAWSRSTGTVFWVSATSGGRAFRARARSMTMLRITVRSQPRTDPLLLIRLSGLRHARSIASCTTSSAAARSFVSRVA
jgi:hypothetical protein